jgi:phosphoglycolate phosphatase
MLHSIPYTLAILDLDGTLVDSFPWFRRTINDDAAVRVYLTKATD